MSYFVIVLIQNIFHYFYLIILKIQIKYPWYKSLVKREYDVEIYIYRLYCSKEIKFSK
jgi:hypothetical protein